MNVPEKLSHFRGSDRNSQLSCTYDWADCPGSGRLPRFESRRHRAWRIPYRVSQRSFDLGV